MRPWRRARIYRVRRRRLRRLNRPGCLLPIMLVIIIIGLIIYLI